MEMFRSLARLLAAAAVVAACTDITVPAKPTRVAAVRVIPFAAWLQPGDTLRLTALPLDPNGDPVSRSVRVAWYSRAPSVADVDESGRVSAASPGDTEIVASIEGVEGSALVHVLNTPAATVPFRLIAAGDDFTCGVDVLGGTACWGSNALGQLGNGGFPGGRFPTPVAGPAGVTAMAAGTRHACAIGAEGQAWCWGWNSVGQVGSAVSDKIARDPRPVALPGRFLVLAAGSGHSCALRDDGVALCWGAGGLGQLGGRSTPPVATTQVASAEPFTTLTAGHSHTCALDRAGAAWCWGWNGSGQLGAETGECQAGAPCSAQPVRVGAGLHFRLLAAGSAFTCALEAGGQAHCWGANALGQLGRRGPASPDPMPVTGVPAFVDLAAGTEHACGLTGAGVVFCWGANRQGQLGDGTTESRPGPVEAGAAPVPALRIAAGGAHTCVIATDGRAVCWGANAAGQLGPFPVTQ